MKGKLGLSKSESKAAWKKIMPKKVQWPLQATKRAKKGKWDTLEQRMWNVFDKDKD